MDILIPSTENIFLQKGIAEGNLQSFRQLFNIYAHRLIVFSQSILRNREVAIEIVDDVFVKLWKNRRQAGEIKNITVYLYSAVKNSSLNYLSKKAREQQTDPFDFINIQIEAEQNPETKLISNELLKKLEAAVEKLPPRCKMIFKLVREDGLKYKEVADILNVSVNTVDAQMVIAVKRISEQMKGHILF